MESPAPYHDNVYKGPALRDKTCRNKQNKKPNQHSVPRPAEGVSGTTKRLTSVQERRTEPWAEGGGENLRKPQNKISGSPRPSPSPPRRDHPVQWYRPPRKVGVRLRQQLTSVYHSRLVLAPSQRHLSGSGGSGRQNGMKHLLRLRRRGEGLMFRLFPVIKKLLSELALRGSRFAFRRPSSLKNVSNLLVGQLHYHINGSLCLRKRKRCRMDVICVIVFGWICSLIRCGAIPASTAAPRMSESC